VTLSKIAQVLFTRVPISGKTKKRLTPFLTAQQAADLHQGMILDTMSVMKKVRADVFICYEPAAGAEQLLKTLAGKTRVYPQRGRTLDRRVINCLVDLRQRGYRAAYFIVSDSPSVKPGYLQQAIRALSGPHPVVVIGPSHDRGAYLLGTNRLEDLGFLEHIPWGEDRVFHLLASQSLLAGYRVRPLPIVKDIDKRQDVYWLFEEAVRVSSKELKHVKNFFRVFGKSIFYAHVTKQALAR